MLLIHFRLKILAHSLIHLLATHLLPYSTGQPPCKSCMSDLPLRLMLCQNTADPRTGATDTPNRGNAVCPPFGTWKH